MKRLFMGPLVTELVNNMEVHLGTEEWDEDELKVFRKAKMFIYSAHDTTLSHLMNSLGLFDGDQPVYASVLMLELHQIEDIPSLKVSLGSEPQAYGFLCQPICIVCFMLMHVQ